MNKNRLPITILSIDGMALSGSSKANAIMAANPANLIALWNNYPNMTIMPDKNFDQTTDKAAPMAELLMGRKISSNFKVVEEQISKVRDNSGANLAMEYVIKHNSSLHLIGHVYDHNHSSVRHLEEILKMAKEKNIYNLFLHLIVGKKEGAKNKVEEIETIVKKNGIGEILSISGIKNIFIEANNLINVNKFVNCLALGKGKYYSTPEQALESNWHKDDFPPCVLVNSIKPITQLGDFDSLICFDYNAADLLPALRLIKNEYSKARKFLHVSTLVRSNEFFDIDGFFEPERDAKLCQWLNKKGLKQSYVADTASLPLLKEVADNETAATKLVSITGFDGKSVRSYYDKLANCIFNNCEKNDMIFVGSGIIGEIAKAGHLAQTVAAVRILDVFLSLLIEKILISGGTLVLTSCFGGAEKVNIETRPNPTFFIVVSNLIRKKTPFSKKPILREGFIPNFTPNERFLFDASATILDIIGVEKPDFVSGKSFLQEIISKDYLYEN